MGEMIGSSNKTGTGRFPSVFSIVGIFPAVLIATRSNVVGVVPGLGFLFFFFLAKSP